MHGKYRKSDAISLPNTSCAAQIFPSCVASEVFKPFIEGASIYYRGLGIRKWTNFCLWTGRKPLNAIASYSQPYLLVKLDLVSAIRAAPPNPDVSITTHNGVSDKAIHSTVPCP